MNFASPNFLPLNFKFRYSSFVEKIYERHKIKNQNTNIAITGENLSGKSTVGLKLQEEFSKYITKNKNHLCFTFKKFFELAESESVNNCVVLFDEIGSESRSERWWETESQILGEILELWGMKKCILLLTLPNWEKLTGSVKGMIHYRIHCSIDLDFYSRRPIYRALVMRKFISFKKDKTIFVPFRNITVEKTEEIDRLYNEYWPQKVNNYKEKLQKFRERLEKKEESLYP